MHQITLEVTGARAGQTFQFRGHQFVNGRVTVSGNSPEAVLGAANYLAATQQAFPLGSEELAAAKARTEAKKEAPSGKRQVRPGEGSGGSEKVLDRDQAASKPPAEGGAAGQSGAADAASGAEGVVPAGGGREAAGDAQSSPGSDGLSPEDGKKDAKTSDAKTDKKSAKK